MADTCHMSNIEVMGTANENLDLISRSALIAEYDRVHIGPPGGARKLIEDAPTVDAVPVVHGRWLGESGDYTCSRCGQEAPNDGYYPAPYCYECGANMIDGGQR